MFEIVQRDEDLRRGQPFGAQHVGPDLTECDLAGRRSGLRIFQAGAAALGQPQAPGAERDRTR